MPQPFARLWVVTATWAHPIWSRYTVSLADLTTATEKPPTKYRDDVTHEVLVYALSPESPADVKDGEYGLADAPSIWRLDPANHAYQFKAESDEAAAARIGELVDAIRTGHFNPDTDFSARWDVLFRDAVNLKKIAMDGVS